MLIHPWDEATREEWQRVLATADFGQLITAGHVDGFPVVVPTHFLYDGDSTVLLHLARPNPVWKALDADPHVVLALTGDYTYVEAEWNTEPGTDPAYGVPTSYYTAVQLLCRAEVVDDPDEKAAILATQLDHFEPADSVRVTADHGQRERPPPAPRHPRPAAAPRGRARQDEVRRQQAARAPPRDRRPPRRAGRPDGLRPGTCSGARLSTIPARRREYVESPGRRTERAPSARSAT